jgi:guanosine-3',5'-bis(diphosphate) 3'-pyrophosphohydrolase
MLRQYELVDRVLGYDPKADEALINRAYVYAMKQHGSQKRANGDPYFSHPIEVAGILTDLKLDTATIVTALLHDTIEDTGATMEELTKLFGPQVAALVDGVTKLTRIELTSERSKQAENFRKFLLAMSNDIRVLLVKLADRLHNMRTLHFISSAEKRQRIALETMEIYAPLAGRMGIQEIREELEDLAFKELNPEAREALIRRLDDFRETRGDSVKEIAEEIRAKLEENGLSCTVIGREKRPYSVWRKMERRAISLEQLSDIFGFRVIVEDVPECYRALGVLHTTWPMVPGRFKDYISTPKANGYRSLHTTLVGPQRKRAEVQIRTRKMHEIAEYGIAAHWIYKEAGGGDSSGEFAATFRWLRQLIEMLEHGASPEEFLEHTKLQMYSDQVFCFTPNGLLISLPRGATPIDFAYAVHTEIGDTCVGCKINGRHMPLRTRLENGDEVEIIRSQAQKPSPAWEAIVATGKARSAIRRAIRATKQAEFGKLGRQILKTAFEAAGREISDTLLERAIKPLRKADLGELLASVGDGTVSPQQVLEIVFPEDQKRKGGRKRNTTQMNGKTGQAGSVRVTSRAMGLATRFAPDMFPLPGERIVGIMMPGEGITIYPIDAPALEEFDGDAQRWIDAVWDIDPENPQTFPARLRITAKNEVGSLGHIATLIADYGANISNLSLAQRDADFYDMQIDLDVRDLKHLTRIMAALKGLSCVNMVVRPPR